MNKCKNCSTSFEVAPEDVAFYKKMDVPEPTWCPTCRMQRRMCFRNERNLYKSKCHLSGQDIISIYPPTSPFIVYEQKIWWSDKWDSLEFGRDYDFDRPFFDQFKDLMLEVPRLNLQNWSNENSDFANDTSTLKDCYLCFNGEEAQNNYYCNTFGYGNNSMDLFWCLACQLCYECTKVHKSYHCFWCENLKNSTDCFFCKDCLSCKNCFGCVNLRQKEYCIFNEQKTKEEYKSFIKNYNFTHTNIQKSLEELNTLYLSLPHKNLQIHNSENCIGDHISDSKNCTECFDVMNSENVKYVWDGIVVDSMDCFNTGVNANHIYESVGVYSSFNMKFCDKCNKGSSDLQYCDFCSSCEFCFGCVEMQHKKYCILNKQYTKEEYEDLVPQIIDHMRKTGEYGEFFPYHLSPFGYNDTLAQEYFPLNKEQALEKGFNWNDYVQPKVTGSKTIPSIRLPETILEVPDDILSWAIECEGCAKSFKIIPQELTFYRTHNLPIPHFCPDCRNYARKSKINPRILFDRKCNKCSANIKTTYHPDRPEKVYCEQCYLDEVY